MTAKYTAAVFTPPTALGSGGIDTAFDGDLSKCQFPVEHRILNDALGLPVTGYLYTPEAYPHFTFLKNESGHNEQADGNGGRTAACVQRHVVTHSGQGDAVVFNGSVFVNGTKPGSTSFLANPAGVLLNGDVIAGAHGVYLNPYETSLTDGGFDVAAVGSVSRLNRTNDTGAKKAFWSGYRVMSEGTKEIDTGYAAIGPMKIGADFSFATLPSSGTYMQAAVTLKANQRIYGNASGVDPCGVPRRPDSLGAGEFITYNGSAWVFVAGNSATLQVSAAQATVTQAFRHAGNALGFFAATPSAKPTVSGSRGGNAALGSLINALATLGLITDSTTP
jgi:hypothetical protein